MVKRTETNQLYRCPTCGMVDHAVQDGTGHWEQGTSEKWDTDKTYCYYILACSNCGAINEMQQVTSKDTYSREDGIKAIIALQATLDIVETPEQAAIGWDAMTEAEKQMTTYAHKAVCIGFEESEPLSDIPTPVLPPTAEIE